MATSKDIADFIVEQIASAGNVSARKMFGEYAVYFDGKVVALVCDDQLFVKPTDAGREYIGTPVEGQPYPGAKLYYLIADDKLEDPRWLSALIRITADEVPEPKPKKKPAKKRVMK